MALIPSSSYSGQVSTSDAAYPLGKAQNESVSGDGTGTPLERDWINDVWGFLQALLANGSVTASGVPDKVGASQYIDALHASTHVWTGLNDFTQPVILADSGIAAILAGSSNELLYGNNVAVPTPRTRHSWVRLTSVMRGVGADIYMFHGEVNINNATGSVDWTLDLPDGAVVSTIEVIVSSDSSASSKLSASIQRVTFADPSTPGAPTLGSATVQVASSNIQTLTLTGPWTVANATSHLVVAVVAANAVVPATSVYGIVSGIRVTWSDLGPRSF